MDRSVVAIRVHEFERGAELVKFGFVWLLSSNIDDCSSESYTPFLIAMCSNFSKIYVH